MYFCSNDSVGIDDVDFCHGNATHISLCSNEADILEFYHKTDNETLVVWNEAHSNHRFLDHLFFACTQEFGSQLALNSYIKLPAT